MRPSFGSCRKSRNSFLLLPIALYCFSFIHLMNEQRDKRGCLLIGSYKLQILFCTFSHYVNVITSCHILTNFVFKEEVTTCVCFLDVPFLHKIQVTNKCYDDSGREMVSKKQFRKTGFCKRACSLPWRVFRAVLCDRATLC